MNNILPISVRFVKTLADRLPLLDSETFHRINAYNFFPLKDRKIRHAYRINLARGPIKI